MPDSNFNTDPDPDPDMHQYDAVPHADPTPSSQVLENPIFFTFSDLRKFTFFYLSHQCQRCHNFKYFFLDSILKFCGKIVRLLTFSFARH